MDTKTDTDLTTPSLFASIRPLLAYYSLTVRYRLQIDSQLHMTTMTTRFRLIFRGIRGGMYYCFDKITGKRTSLKTTDKDSAQQVIDAKNNAERQPVLNLQIAKAYLAGTDNGMATRTWQNALDALIDTKLGNNQHRWKTAAKTKPLRHCCLA